MVAGADSIDDMAQLRHGGMGRVFAGAYAPSTLGSFLRSFTFGHVRQLDAVASRFLAGLAAQAPLIATADGNCDRVMVDIDDTIVEVHGYAKQGSGYGYSGVRGLNALLATVSTSQSAPVVVAQRLRKGSCGSPRGAARLVADALRTVASLSSAKSLVRADSAFYGHAAVRAAIRGGADVSVTVRLDPKVKAAIATIGEDAWTPIEYTDAVFDEQTQTWISRAEVAEIPFTAFTSRKKAEQVGGRLVVRRIPDLNPGRNHGQQTLFDTWRFHAFFTTTDREHADTVAADQTHRGHAIIEQVHADLKHSALAHLPSGKFTANAAWLVLADGIQPDPRRRDHHRTGTRQGHHRDDSPQTDHRARPGGVLRPTGHPPPADGLAMGDRLERPVRPGMRTTTGTADLTTPADTGAEDQPGTTWQRGQPNSHAHTPHDPSTPAPTTQPLLIGGSRLNR